ncbi:MAG: hypothetical protein ACLFMU_09845, partial [Bacteroidales bacterium]
MKALTPILIALVLFSFTAKAGATEETESRPDRVKEAIEADPGKNFLVYKYEIRQNIAQPAVRLTQRAFEEADSLNADFVLLHMNTYGGMVDAA